MKALISHTSSIPTELNVLSQEWVHPSQKVLGSLRARIPRTSAAYRSAYINKDGGFRLATFHDALGPWYGVVNQPLDFDADGAAVLTAIQVGAVAQAPIMTSGMIFRYATAATIVKAALANALQGNAHIPIRPGAFVEAPPLVPYYKLDGQTFDRVLFDMEGAVGQEPEFAPDSALAWSFAFNWKPAADTLYAPILVDGADIVYQGSQIRLDERAARVIGVDRNGRKYTATATDLAAFDAFPREVVISVDTTSEATLAIETEAALALRRYPRVTHRFHLAPASPYASGTTATVSDDVSRLRYAFTYRRESALAAWRGIREGSFVKILVPGACMDGVATLARVVRRSFSDSAAYPTIEAEEVRPLNAQTVQAASRNTRIVPVAPAGTRLAMLINGMSGGGSGKPPGYFGEAEILELAAASIQGLISPAQIEKIFGSQVSGAVASAVSATTAATATALASLSGLPSGTVPAGVTVPGAQVSGAVGVAATLSALSGLPSGTVPAGVQVPANQLTTGTVPGTVTVPAATVSGALAAANMHNGGTLVNGSTWADATAQTDFNNALAILRAAGVGS